MARVLFLFMDGVGLDGADPHQNPLASANMPALESLLDGQRLLLSTAPFDGPFASLRAVDACLDVAGLPQSASGQAAILTGCNVPAVLGEHYGPKPNPPIRALLKKDNLFMMVTRKQGKTALLNAYPPQYFESIRSGRRLHGAIPMAVTSAGIPLKTAEDLQAGQGMSADFTGAGWTARPDFPPAPVYTPHQAGARLALVAQQYDLAWFDYWLTDYAGHRGSLHQATKLLADFDQVLEGLVEAWDLTSDLIVISSDHGNLEDLHIRKHTRNPVPVLLIGPETLRRAFVSDLYSITDLIAPIHRSLFAISPATSPKETPPSPLPAQ